MCILQYVHTKNGGICQSKEKFTLPETNIVPENGWLEYDRFLLGWPSFRGYVSFREDNIYIY